MLSHVLGFGNIDNQGLEGLERRYDAVLRGERGRLVVERGAFGGGGFSQRGQLVAPAPGQGVVLPIGEGVSYIPGEGHAEGGPRPPGGPGRGLVRGADDR